MMKRMTKSERVFNIINNIFMAFILIIMIYPIVNQIAISLSSDSAILSGKVNLIPKGFTLVAYKDVLMDKSFVNAFKNTVLYTIAYTAIQIIFTMSFAYPLSKKNLKGRSMIMTILIFSFLHFASSTASLMFGTGGLIPNYLLIKNLHMVDTYWALILPGAINIWNVIVFKSFFQQIPDSLEEAGKIDVAGVLTIFITIVLPLSKPVIAALTLFTAIAAWSTFFQALIYVPSPEKKLLQVYLNDIMQANIIPSSQQGDVLSNAMSDMEKTNGDALKAACLLCTMLPVMAIYPFVQKYFMAGLMIGSVKG